VNNECPHCNEKSFGWRQLIVLGSFAPVKCANCEEEVLASGWGQLLGVLATLAFGVATAPLWQSVSGEKSVLLIPLAAIVFAIFRLLTTKLVKAHTRETDPSPFTPDPNNDKIILVQGWSETELRQILADFVDEDLTLFSSFGFEIEERSEDSFALTFPEDIHPNEFGLLVNYLAYPVGFDLKARTVVVAGRATLNSDFDGLPRSLAGSKAIFYLPDQDKDHDVVYLQTESGLTLARSCSEGTWFRVKEPRLPGAVSAVAWSRDKS